MPENPGMDKNQPASQPARHKGAGAAAQRGPALVFPLDDKLSERGERWYKKGTIEFSSPRVVNE